MRRKAFLTVAVLALLVASGATGAWAAAPFGWFGGLARAGNAGNGVLAVQGWALADTGGFAVDVNTQNNKPGVAYAELLIDGAIAANSQRDCHFDSTEGGLSDCYGLRRPDLEQNFPGLQDAPHAGFRFVIDVGDLINSD